MSFPPDFQPNPYPGAPNPMFPPQSGFTVPPTLGGVQPGAMQALSGTAPLGTPGQEGTDAAPAALPSLFDERPEVDYSIRYAADRREALGRRLMLEIQRYHAAVDPRRVNAIQWKRDWEMLQSDSPVPWPNAARQRAPYTRMAAVAHMVRLQQMICGASPAFLAEGKTPEAQLVSEKAEECIASKLEDAHWTQAARDIHNELSQTGAAALWVTWDWKTVWSPVHKVEQKPHEAIAAEIQAGTEPMQALQQSVTRDRKGRPRVTLEWEEQTLYDGVKLTPVNFDDLICLPASARCVEDLWAIGNRVVLQGRDLLEGVRKKIYSAEAVNTLLGRQSDPPGEYREEQVIFQGVMLPDGGGGPPEEDLYREYDCVKLALLGNWLEGVPGVPRGVLTWALVTVHPLTKTVLELRHSPYQHGRCPCTLFRYMTRSNEFWGMSVPEVLASVQTQATTAINQFLNLVDVIVNHAGTWLVEEGCDLKRDAFLAGPGQALRVQDINGVKPVEIGAPMVQALEFLLKSLEILKEWSDLLSGTSNPALGRQSEGDKTLGEVRIALNQGNMQFEEQALEVAEIWADVADQLRWLLAQFGTEGATDELGMPAVAYRVTAAGGPEFKQISAHLLASELDFKPAAVSQFADPQTALQQASFFVELSLKHPMFQTSPAATLDVLQYLFQKAKFPWTDKVMDELKQGVAQAQQAQAAQQAQQEAMQQQALQQQQDQAAAVQGAPDRQTALKEHQAQQQADQQQFQQVQQSNAEGRAQQMHLAEMLQKAQQLSQAGQPAPNGTGG